MLIKNAIQRCEEANENIGDALFYAGLSQECAIHVDQQKCLCKTLNEGRNPIPGIYICHSVPLHSM